MGLRGSPAAIGLALVAIVAASLLAGCQELGDNIGVANRTDVELHFVEVIGDKTYQLVSLPPGQSTALLSGVLGGSSLLATTKGCTIGDIVALTADGREFARHGPPLCIGDTWVVTGPGPSGAPSGSAAPS